FGCWQSLQFLNIVFFVSWWAALPSGPACDAEHAVEKFNSVTRPVVEARRAAEAMLLLVGRHRRRIHLRDERLFMDFACLLAEHARRLEAAILRWLHDANRNHDVMNRRDQPLADLRIAAPAERRR